MNFQFQFSTTKQHTLKSGFDSKKNNLKNKTVTESLNEAKILT